MARDLFSRTPQIAAIETIRKPYVFPFALANGITVPNPGYNYGGGRPARRHGCVGPSGPKAAHVPACPVADRSRSRAWYFGAGAVRYFPRR